MFTGKALFAFALGVVVAIAAAFHYLAPDVMHAIGRALHGG
jgi:hypothetical protein